MSTVLALIVLVLAVVLAIETLRRTRDAAGPLSRKDRLRRVLALGLLVVFVAGFGLCGGAGFVFGVAGFLSRNSADRGYAMVALVPGLVGLAIAFAGGWTLRKFRRNKAADLATGRPDAEADKP